MHRAAPPLFMALACAALAGQGDGWEQGERVAVQVSLTERGQHAMGEAVRAVDTTTAATLLVTALEVQDGRLAAVSVQVQGFRLRRGAGPPAEEPDRQARLTRSGEGGLQVQPPAEGQPPLPGPVLGLLRELAGWLDRGLDRALLPPAEGASPAARWRPDPADLSRAFVPGGTDVAIAPDGERLELALEAGEGRVRVAGEGPLPLASLPGARSARLEGAPTSWLEVRAEWPATRSPARGGTIEATWRFRGAATNVLPDGKQARITAELERRLVLTIAPAP